jgi:hypothetical protein
MKAAAQALHRFCSPFGLRTTIVVDGSDVVGRMQIFRAGDVARAWIQLGVAIVWHGDTPIGA